MEIEIPDLEDVRFVERCGACYGYGVTGKRETCWRCDGQKTVLTAVGGRLIAFLKGLGINVKEDGWKDVAP